MSKPLTVKQKAFADHYIKYGNATQAYKDAHYKWSNENVASANAKLLLQNHKVVDYIRKRQEKIDSKVFGEQVNVKTELYKQINNVAEIDFANNVVTDRKYIEQDGEGNNIEVTEKVVPVRLNDLTRMLELLARINGEVHGEEAEVYKVVTINNDIGE